MNIKFSLLSILTVVTLAVLVVSLVNARYEISKKASELADSKSDALTLRRRLGEHANESSQEFSLCRFYDYATGSELRYRVKAPKDAAFRLMYSTESLTDSRLPTTGKELALNGASEFVIALRFDEAKLSILVVPEAADGSPQGRWHVTSIKGTRWIKQITDATSDIRSTSIVGRHVKPFYFELEKPFRIIEFDSNPEHQLLIWIEPIQATKQSETLRVSLIGSA